MSDIWSRAWCEATQTPNFNLKGISAIPDAVKHPPDYVPRVFSCSTEFGDNVAESRSPTPEPDAYSCFPFVRKKRKAKPKTSKPPPTTPAPRRSGCGEKIPNFKAPPPSSPRPSSKSSVGSLLTPPISPGRVKIRTLSRTSSSTSSGYLYHLSPPESPHHSAVESPRYEHPTSKNPWFAQAPLISKNKNPSPRMTHPQHNKNESFLEAKIAEMARNSMAITGTIAQATAEDYIDAHANPSPKITITKDNGVLEYLETPMRNCAYSAPPTPRNSSNLSASPPPAYGSKQDQPPQITRVRSNMDQPPSKSNAKLSASPNQDYALKSKQPTSKINSPGQQSKPQQQQQLAHSPAQEYHSPAQEYHSPAQQYHPAQEHPLQTVSTEDKAFSNFQNQEQSIKQYKAALVAQFDNPDIDENRPFLSLEKLFTQDQGDQEEEEAGYDGNYYKEDTVDGNYYKGDTMTTYYSTRSYVRRRNTNSNEDRDPESDHLDRYDQRQRSNSRHQILYGEVNGRDIKRISGEFVRIENLEKAVKSRSKAAEEYPQEKMRANPENTGTAGAAADKHNKKYRGTGSNPVGQQTGRVGNGKRRNAETNGKVRNTADTKHSVPRIQLQNSDPANDNQSIVFLGRDGNVLAESRLSSVNSPTRVRRVRSSLMLSGLPAWSLEPDVNYPDDELGVERIEACQLLKEISNQLETLKSRTNSPTELICYPLPNKAALGTELLMPENAFFAASGQFRTKHPGRLGTHIPRQSTDDSHNSEDPQPTYLPPNHRTNQPTYLPPNQRTNQRQSDGPRGKLRRQKEFNFE